MIEIVQKYEVWPLLHINTSHITLRQGKLTEEQIGNQILETARAQGSEDDITIIVVQISFP